MPPQPRDPTTAKPRPGTGPDQRAVARAFRNAAARYAANDFLHAEVRSRLLERLDFVRLDPSVVLDLGAGPPEATDEVARRFPGATVIAADLVPEMLGAAPRQWPRVCADAARLPLGEQSVDVVVAAMLLHWCPDVPAVIAEAQRVLRHPGLFLFATLGPDTLRELRRAWPAGDRHDHTLAFTDMHNLGDELVRAGFAEPVVDAETLTITYRAIARLFDDLRAVGATNVARGRRPTLTGRRRWAAMTAAYEKERTSAGALPASIEVIYGQAWAGGLRSDRPAQPGEVSVPLERLSRRRAGP
jgi:malonyl-CoA O-methyltransferase